jgi:hypothetical protein
MTVYAILTTAAPSGELDAAILNAFPGNALQINYDQWLVSDSARKTTKEVCDAIGASEGKFGQIVVFAISGYYGFHRTDLWEWLKTRAELT